MCMYIVQIVYISHIMFFRLPYPIHYFIISHLRGICYKFPIYRFDYKMYNANACMSHHHSCIYNFITAKLQTRSSSIGEHVIYIHIVNYWEMIITCNIDNNIAYHQLIIDFFFTINLFTSALHFYWIFIEAIWFSTTWCVGMYLWWGI